MGCKNSKNILSDYNNILLIDYLKYDNVRPVVKKFLYQQKINSYSLFFVNTENRGFKQNQILLVDMATYYSIRIPKVWIIVLNISNSGAILVKNSYNSIIDKIMLTEIVI
jgi:hypothetical protein